MRFIILFLLSACVEPILKEPDAQLKQCYIPNVITLSYKLADQEHNAAQKAIKYWNLTAQKKLFIINDNDAFDDPAYYSTYIRPGKWLNKIPNDGSCAFVSIKTYKHCITGSLIEINRGCKLEGLQLETLFRHTIGHVLGLNNVSSGDSLMYSGIVKNRNILHPVNADEETINILDDLYKIKRR